MAAEQNPPSTLDPPPLGTVERWAFEFVSTTDVESKLAPPAPPARWEDAPPARRLRAPGRPPGWRVAARSPRAPGPQALATPAGRARLFAILLHHELQAAELFAWAVLAFPAAPRALRRGFVRLALEELEHLALYRAHLEAQGGSVGAEPVRDWFWSRLAACASPESFLAAMGMGLEAGNLEHAAGWARKLRLCGDEVGAALLERVAREEEDHVRFGVRWFERLAGGTDFERWRAALPPALWPGTLRGVPLARDARLRAGLDAAFLERLAELPAGSPGPLPRSEPCP